MVNESEPSSSDAHRKKRMRLASDEEADGEELDAMGEEAEEDEIADIPIEPRVWDRDADGYVEGSILRIRMHNFLTYVDAELRPGPDLNMLIGPNGNGKSAIACAIAIGLNFPVKVLGRADKLRAYVNDKTDEDEAWVEIELRGKQGEDNLVIKRAFSKADDRSKFTLNGEHSTAAQVNEAMLRLNIQVNNLCNFLPQDKVANFAKMAPPQLLVETEKSIGGSELVHLHNTLIAERKVQKEHEEVLQAQAESLRRKKEKQAHSEEEVRSFQERKEIQQKLEVSKLLLALSDYTNARSRHQETKTRRNEVENEIKELEHANKPFMDSQAALKGIVNHYDGALRIIKEKSRKMAKDSKNESDAITKGDEAMSSLRQKMEKIREEERTRIANIDSARRAYNQLKKKVDDKPAEPDFTELDARLEDLRAARSEAERKKAEQEAELENIQREDRATKQELDRSQKRLAQLDDAQALRDAALKKDDDGLWRVVCWIRKNVDAFKGKVHEPVRLSVQARDPRHTAIIESAVGRDLWSTIVFEEHADYDTLMRVVNDEKRLGQGIKVNGGVVGHKKTPAEHEIPYSQEQLRAWGFDCNVIDLLQGPDAVLSYMCQHSKLQKNPVSFSRDIDVQAVQNSRVVSRYYTPDGSFSINVSKYGARNVQSEMRALKNSGLLRQGADPEEIAARTAEVEGYHKQLADGHARGSGIAKIIARLDKELDQMKQERAQLDAERVALKKPLSDWQKAKVQLPARLRTLEQAEKQPTGEQRRKELQAKMSDMNAKRYGHVQKRTELALRAGKLSVNQTILSLRQLQASTDLRAMTESANEKDQELARKQEELSDLADRTKHYLNLAKEMLKAYEAMREEASEETNAAVDVVSNSDEGLPSHQDLELERGQLEAQLLVTQEIDPSVLRAYEKRETEIADLERHVETAERKLANSTAIIDETKGVWHPKLKSLLAKISEKFGNAFERMGLQGEVGILQHEDYDKWGVQIRVSFRDGEEMQVLNSHRQSGGERALTTVMYLMALAELSQAPFTLVDEINQGMDHRVERQVHNQLVQLTCQDSVGQYFLLTPKLLPNLYYHPRMKVLVINKGLWMPKSTTALTLKRVLEKKTKKNRANGIVTTARAAPLAPLVPTVG